MMTEAQALEELKDLVAWEKEPTLTKSQLLRCLTKNQRYIDYPAPGTVVEFGTVVRPANSRRTYRCTFGGTIAGSLAANCGERFFDGAVTWEDDGPAHAERYDIRGAAHDAWELKVAADAEQIDVVDKDTKIPLTQRMENSERMANRFLPLVIR